VDALLDHARYGSLVLVTITTVVSGVAEELFFRGSLFAALPARWRVAGSSVLYAVATVFTGVPLLVLAALALGLLVSAQRRVTGGFLGPVITHLTWSVGMLYLLPITLDLGRTP
jgi:membrane protease YdiL (CAAX protease family)